MKPPLTWVVVCDGAKARLFEHKGPLSGLEPLPDGEMSETILPGREIDRSRPARVHDRMGPGRHAVEPRADAQRLQKQAFLKTVAERLDAAAIAQRFQRLVLVAPPEALGQLRQALGDAASGKVVAELPKDLTNLRNDQLPKHLEKVMVP